jgi:hypothetical protein
MVMFVISKLCLDNLKAFMIIFQRIFDNFVFTSLNKYFLRSLTLVDVIG